MEGDGDITATPVAANGTIRYPNPLEVKFGVISEKIIEQLRALVTAIFPIKYSEKFYRDVLASGEYSKLAFYSTDMVVGAICCRIEQSKLYIMTIGVLAPYRGAGIGTKLLEAVIAEAEKDPLISEIYLHVQENNSGAKAFYQSLKFVEKEHVPNYYKRLTPSGAYVLSRSVSH